MANMDIEVVRLHRIEGESKVKAFVDIAIGEFVVKGLRVVDGGKGLFLGLPQEKSKDGKWYNVFYPKNELALKDLSDKVLAVYQE